MSCPGLAITSVISDPEAGKAFISDPGRTYPDSQVPSKRWLNQNLIMVIIHRCKSFISILLFVFLHAISLYYCTDSSKNLYCIIIFKMFYQVSIHTHTHIVCRYTYFYTKIYITHTCFHTLRHSNSSTGLFLLHSSLSGCNIRPRS